MKVTVAGKVVGVVKDGRYEKRARAAYRPRGFALSPGEIAQAKRAGATGYLFTDKDTGRRYAAPLIETGPIVSWGYGEQIVIERKHFAEVPSTAQGRLF